MLFLYIAIFALVTVAVAYVFLVMPRWSDAADMDLQSTDYALDGLFGKDIPRSSLSAFDSAKAEGYGIALTVQLTADQRLVVFPDNDLKRLCGIQGRICNMNASQLKDLRLGRSEERIPSLASVLKLIDGHVPLLIEIRPAPNTEQLCKRLSELMDGYSGAFALRSADPRVLSFFKKYRPRFARGQTVRERYPRSIGALRGFAMKHMLTNVISRPDFFVIDRRLVREPAFLIATRLFHSKGFVRGIRAEEQYRACRRHSLYAVFENIRPQ